MLVIKKKYIRVFSLILVSIFILTNTTVYAQTFTDVPNNHWAKEYIEKMSDAGIIKGDNGKFNPAGNVTKSEAVVMMSRLLSVDKDTVSKAKQKYQSLLDEVGIQTWFQEGIAVALAANIVSEDTVKTFRTNGKDNVAQKTEVCIYLTRAMGLESQAKGKTIIVLPFTDTELIPASAAPYINMMIEKGIINEQGDANGKFNPTETVNRAMMAKMLSVAYDVMKDGNTTPTVPTVPDTNDNTNEKTVTVTGTVSSVMRATDLMYITVEDRNGSKTAYTINSSSDISLGDEELDYDELYMSYELIKGLKIEAKVTEDFKVISLEAEGITEEYSGTISSIIKGTPTMITIEYEVKSGKSTDTEKKAFYVDEDADITIDDKDAYVSQLATGDQADVKVKNSKIVEIEAQSKYLELEGTIVEIKFTPDPILVIEDEDGKEYEFAIDSKARIERNGKRAQIADLRKIDVVEIEVKYNVITDIDAEVVESEDEGSIQSILISSSPELAIKSRDGDINTYTVSKNAAIEIDREDSDIYGLRLGYYVELEIEGSEIVSIDAEAREQSERYEGTVESVISKSNIIVISVPNKTTGKDDVITITVIDDTTILAPNGSKARLSEIEKGDKIMVMGSLDGTSFTATSIVILAW